MTEFGFINFFWAHTSVTCDQKAWAISRFWGAKFYFLAQSKWPVLFLAHQK
jgi:hypothetical protein